MSLDIAAAALNPASAAAPGAAGGSVSVGYNASLTDISAFSQSMAQAGARLEPQAVQGPGEAAKMLMKPFEALNADAQRLGAEASKASAEGREMTPSEMVNLTMRSQEFMFHATLTSNIATKTSDAVSQLFRQQS